MAIGNNLMKNHIRGFRTEISRAKLRGKDAFFTWFNSSKNAQDSFVKGTWDFAFHIALQIPSYISKPETKTILEIGHGGGRLLDAASRYFSKAMGVDIHKENSFVERELKERGTKNIKLLRGNGHNIPTDESSVDVVFSFIVLQHVEKIEIFRKYFEESYRVLKPGGVAILYYSRYSKLSKGKSEVWLYLLDKLLERFFLPRGYKELLSVVNDVNLVVSTNYVKEISKKIGFEVEKVLISRINVPDGVDVYGGQHGVLLRKPL